MEDGILGQLSLHPKRIKIQPSFLIVDVDDDGDESLTVVVDGEVRGEVEENQSGQRPPWKGIGWSVLETLIPAHPMLDLKHATGCGALLGN